MMGCYRIARVLVIELTIATSGQMMLLRVCVLALLPNPHMIGVMPAASVHGHRKLTQRAQTGAVLTAPSLCLSPSCIIQAPTHVQIRLAAHAKRRVERPPQLRATEL